HSLSQEQLKSCRFCRDARNIYERKSSKITIKFRSSKVKVHQQDTVLNCKLLSHTKSYQTYTKTTSTKHYDYLSYSSVSRSVVNRHHLTTSTCSRVSTININVQRPFQVCDVCRKPATIFQCCLPLC